MAQVCGSQVSAINPEDGTIETISPMGGHIVGPDDLAFDKDGNLYCTEITSNRVSVLRRDGSARVLNDEIAVANPITMHQERLFVGELRFGGRIYELDRGTGAARVIASDLPMPNAFEVGPDGKLYFPLMGANQIWRVGLEGGEPEIVASGLGTPDSVKFDRNGFIISTQIGSGEVLRIDPRDGSRTVLAVIEPGLDNCTFVGDRLFVSHIAGSVLEVLPGGRIRTLVGDGLQFPMGLAANDAGDVYVADAMMAYAIAADGRMRRVGGTAAPGSPGAVRGVAASGATNWIVTTTHGTVVRWDPGSADASELASGYECLMGVAVIADGTVVFCDYVDGRVITIRGGQTEEVARGLDRPTGVAISPDGRIFVAEAGTGRILALCDRTPETILDGLGEPHGLAISGEHLFVLDVLHKSVIACNLQGDEVSVLATRLPVGAPIGVIPKALGGFGTMSGPLMPFAGLAVDANANIIIAADAEGSVLRLQRA